jgi:hypothetical protein
VGARKQYEQSLALCKELDDAEFTAQINVSLAAIDLVEKKYSEGEALARQAISGYEKANAIGNLAWSEAILARHLLALGNSTEAEKEVVKSMTHSHQGTGQTPRYEAAFADARVKAKLGKSAEAHAELEATLASARKFGYRVYEYETRLAMAEIAMPSRTPSARPDLIALEKESREHGVLLVANQAQALLAEPQGKGK